MMNDHDLLQDTIQDQYDTMEANKDEMEKIRLEVTVISAEKTMQKKELNRVNTLYTKLQRDNKENREAYNLMVDEVSKINITNSGYRALIVESDGKMAAFQKDVRSLQ
jgi:septation ring formation regulator EzrA